MIGQTLLSRYKITDELGAGGMGEVFLAEDSELGRRVAIKFLPKGYGADGALLKRFEREAQAAAALNHPNIITIYDAGSHEGRPFLVMEHVDGETLSHLIDRRDVSIGRALEIASQVCEGLSAAHEAGITHRDIKPDNILIDKKGRVRILDFGLAKLTGATALTAIESTVGTVFYMSPEQARGDEVDQRTDLFSAGVVLYEMLAGQRPFQGDHLAAVSNAIMNEEAQPLRRYNNAATDELETILSKLLAKDRNERYPNAAALLVDLKREGRNISSASRSGSTTAHAKGSAHRSGFRTWRGAALSGLLIVGALVIGWLMGRQMSQKSSSEATNQAVRIASVEKSYVLTVDDVRGLSVPNPRLVGRSMIYLDNGAPSDTLVILVPGVGSDHRAFERFLELSRHRTIAPTFVGFEPVAMSRPTLSIDDHLYLLRTLLEELGRRHRPSVTMLVGFSSGSDLCLRLVASDDGPGIELDGLIALGPNVSLETCFVTRRFAAFSSDDPAGVLSLLKEVGQGIDALPAWLTIHQYFVWTFQKMETDLDPLTRLAADIVAPFERPGDPLAEWFRAAVSKVPQVRCVFAADNVYAEALLSRHLENGVLGDKFSEKMFVFEPVDHLGLSEPDFVLRYIEQVLEKLRQGESLVDEHPGQVSSRGSSIAVLPFINASGDPEQEYFSDGLTEDIITEFSSYHELSVIARNSTRRYKGGDIDVREVGTDLGARYILQGSIRRSGQRIRVSVQLSNAEDGRSVWGTNYERDLTARDLFELQDELTLQVVTAIAGPTGAMTRAELPGARRKPPASLESYDCVLRAYEYIQVHTAENHRAARDCLEGVTESDPDYVDGRAWLAYLYADQFHHRWNERPDEYDSLDRALAIAEEAVRLDGANHVAHAGLALTCFLRGETERGKSEAYRAIDLNPNNAVWLALLGNYLALNDDFDRGIPMARKAVVLNPYPPGWVGIAFFVEQYWHERYEEALIEARRIEMEGDFREPLFLAATLGQLDRPEDAQRHLEEMRRLLGRPIEDLRGELIERHAFSPGLTDHLMEGLEKAGLEGVAGGPSH